MRAKKSVSVKVMVLLLAVVLLIGGVVGGTLAYLIATSGAVQNTFVAGNIGELTLSENTGNSYMIIPGKNIEKDPVVEFSGNNVKAIVFLKVEAEGWTSKTSDDFKTTTYTIGSGDKEMKWTLEGWTRMDETEDGEVYYRTVEAKADEEWNIIKDNTITVGSGITKKDLGENSIYLKSLTFTAYAIQTDGFNDIGAAWEQAKTATN